MIISFARKFTFVAIPKTASQAIRMHLRPLLQDAFWEQSVYGKPRSFPVPALAQMGHGHLRVSEIQPFLLPGMWQDMFSFAFVRNPFDRFISFCTYYGGSKLADSGNPAEAMKAMIGDRDLREHVFMQPQHLFLQDANGDLAVSFVGRFERLQSDFTKVCEQLGIAATGLNRVNASLHRPRRCQFDAELLEMVRNLYRVDFEEFGYDQNLPEDM